MTVYVITKGTYSDYHICGVALDRLKTHLYISLVAERNYANCNNII